MKKTVRLSMDVDYDASKTNAEQLARGVSILLGNALEMPGILVDHGSVAFGIIHVEPSPGDEVPNQAIFDALKPVTPAEVYAHERMVAIGRELLQLGRGFLDRMSGVINQEEPHVPADKFPLSPEQLAQCQDEPAVREWEIWAEGFATSGERGGASLMGTGKGATFADAVLDHYKRNPSETFRPETMSDWGCKLFPTEAEARRNFG